MLRERDVLVVEDSKFQRNTLANQLRQWEYEVYEGADGLEGLDLFEEHAPQIVITDLQMPRLDGFGLVRAVREREPSYTYILVVSGMNDKDSIVSAIASGADDYVTKPFHAAELEVRLAAAERMLGQRSQDMLIFALAQLAGYRSRETGNHLKRVQLFTKILASDLIENTFTQYRPSRVAVLEAMACLHDIGKVAIPDDILNKPGRLSKLEYNIIKKHATIGGTILDDIYAKTGTESLKVARNIVKYHHERWDGSGYPEGLRGEDIPVSARIVALADVFDALVNCRCYKPAFAREECNRIILEEKGKQFDPRVVDAFFRCEEELYSVAEELREE